MNWTERFSTMAGRAALCGEPEMECLAKYGSEPGDYVETGCFFGGSAMIVALAKGDAGVPGRIYTIDPMVLKEDWVNHEPLTVRILMENFVKYGVAWRINLILAKSHPLPLPSWVRPKMSFIDGDHNYDPVLQDWQNLRKITEKYILFHDYVKTGGPWPGIKKVVDRIYEKDHEWELIDHVQNTMVFQKVV